MIRITLDSVGVGHGPGAALPPTTVEFGTGVPVAIAVETEQRPTVLSLVASGRMRVDAGSVEPAGLRERVALVDTPLVAEPPAELRVRTVVAEELVFAGSRLRATPFLRDHGLADYASTPMSALPPLARLRLLTELALLRPGVEALVLTSPERHGGHPAEWWRLAREIASRGYAVLVVTDQASVDAIDLLPHPEAVGPDAVPLFEKQLVMTVPTLLCTEFARLTAGRMSRIALIALMLVPVLYGGLYLWANRDPYSALDRVPAALVVADTGATVDGKAVHYGKDVAAQIVDGHDFDWKIVSAKSAAAGIRNGDYDFTLTLPADFSKNLASSATATPTRASVELTTDDTNSYLASTIAGQAAETVRSSIAERVGREAADRFLLGLNDIHDSLSTASDGAAQLASGSATAASGAAQLATGTAQVASGAKQVAAGNAELSAAGDSVAAQAGQLSSQLPAAAAQIAADLAKAGVPQPTIDQILAQLAPVGAAAQNAAGQLTQVSAQLDQLSAGSAQVATGADQAANGAATLSGGVSQLQTGATQLHDGLATGLAEVPSTDAAARKAQSNAIGDPVAVKTDAVTKATDYGAGLAPFFISLAAWIGIYALFLIVKPLSRRALTAIRKPVRVALAGWLVPGLLGVVQMAALFAVVSLSLKLGVDDPLATYGFMAVVSLTFAAIILALNAWLGSVGQFLGLVLMVVQLVTAGGTFPWQTLPAPLAALHHVLPMTYAVDGIRQLMYGGSGATALHDALVLLCWLLGGVALAVLAATRMTRHRTLRDLRPSLIG